MNYQDNPERERLTWQILGAVTLPEVHAAQTALRLWRERYPEDWSILDAGEQLSLIEDALLEDDSPPGQSPSWTEWQCLEYQVIGARNPLEIAAARPALRQWAERHPEHGQDELLETLFLLLDVVEEGQGGGPFADKQAARELVGQAV